MFKQIFIGVVLALLGSLSVQVQARTLFIDFNNAESEIAVFKQSQQGVASPASSACISLKSTKPLKHSP
jgi:cysteine sulfinate desulfinase/cysteine desulfurase-like protein